MKKGIPGSSWELKGFKYRGWEVEGVEGDGIWEKKLSSTWKWKRLESTGGFKYRAWEVKGISNKKDWKWKGF